MIFPSSLGFIGFRVHMRIDYIRILIFKTLEPGFVGDKFSCGTVLVWYCVELGVCNEGSGSRVQGFRVWVWGLGLRVEGFSVWV